MQRAWVMKVLEGVRGLSIAEIGRVDGSASGRKRGSGAGGKAMRKGVDYAMMSVEMDGMADDGGGQRRLPSPELGGVAELFG